MKKHAEQLLNMRLANNLHKKIKELENIYKTKQAKIYEIKTQIHQAENDFEYTRQNILSKTHRPKYTPPASMHNRKTSEVTEYLLQESHQSNAAFKILDRIKSLNKKIYKPTTFKENIDEAIKVFNSHTDAEANHNLERLGLKETPKPMPTFFNVLQIKPGKKISGALLKNSLSELGNHKIIYDQILYEKKIHIERLKKELSKAERENQKNIDHRTHLDLQRKELVKKVLKSDVGSLNLLMCTYTSGDYDRIYNYFKEYLDIASEELDSSNDTSSLTDDSDSIISSSDSESITSSGDSETSTIIDESNNTSLSTSSEIFQNNFSEQTIEAMETFQRKLLEHATMNVREIAKQSLLKTGNRTRAPVDARDEIRNVPAASLTNHKLNDKTKQLLSEQKSFVDLTTEVQESLIEQRAFLLKIDAFINVNDLTKEDSIHKTLTLYYKQVQNNINYALDDNKEQDPEILKRIDKDLAALDAKIKSEEWWRSLNNSARFITRRIGISDNSKVGKIITSAIVSASFLTYLFYKKPTIGGSSVNLATKAYNFLSNPPKFLEIDSRFILKSALFGITTGLLKAFHDAYAYDYDEMEEAKEMPDALGVNAFEIIQAGDAKFHVGLSTPIEKMHKTNKIVRFIKNTLYSIQQAFISTINYFASMLYKVFDKIRSDPLAISLKNKFLYILNGGLEILIATSKVFIFLFGMVFKAAKAAFANFSKLIRFAALPLKKSIYNFHNTKSFFGALLSAAVIPPACIISISIFMPCILIGSVVGVGTFVLSCFNTLVNAIRQPPIAEKQTDPLPREFLKVEKIEIGGIGWGALLGFNEKYTKPKLTAEQINKLNGYLNTTEGQFVRFGEQIENHYANTYDKLQNKLQEQWQKISGYGVVASYPEILRIQAEMKNLQQQWEKIIISIDDRSILCATLEGFLKKEYLDKRQKFIEIASEKKKKSPLKNQHSSLNNAELIFKVNSSNATPLYINLPQQLSSQELLTTHENSPDEFTIMNNELLELGELAENLNNISKSSYNV